MLILDDKNSGLTFESGISAQLTSPEERRTNIRACGRAVRTAAWTRWRWTRTSSSWPCQLADTKTCEISAFPWTPLDLK